MTRAFLFTMVVRIEVGEKVSRGDAEDFLFETLRPQERGTEVGVPKERRIALVEAGELGCQEERGP